MDEQLANMERNTDATGLYGWVRRAEGYQQQLEAFHESGEFLRAVPPDFVDRLRADVDHHVWPQSRVERLRSLIRAAQLALQAQDFVRVDRLLLEYRDATKIASERYYAVVLFWRERAKVERMREQRLAFRLAQRRRRPRGNVLSDQIPAVELAGRHAGAGRCS